MAPLSILVAPGPYKERLSAEDVADAIEEGFTDIIHTANIVKLPMCDGGTGFVKRIVEHSSGHLKYTDITGPLKHPVTAYYGIVEKSRNKIGVIEAASAAGLALVPREKRDPSLLLLMESES